MSYSDPPPRTTQVSIGVTLNARRYEVNKLELLLAVASFAVGVGGLFSGLFGMNFLNGGEQSRRAFYSALCLILAGVVAIFSRLARCAARAVFMPFSRFCWLVGPGSIVVSVPAVPGWLWSPQGMMVGGRRVIR